ncbi:hypothetical protein D9M71_488260 [compost metagenome]
MHHHATLVTNPLRLVLVANIADDEAGDVAVAQLQHVVEVPASQQQPELGMHHLPAPFGAEQLHQLARRFADTGQRNLLELAVQVGSGQVEHLSQGGLERVGEGEGDQVEVSGQVLSRGVLAGAGEAVEANEQLFHAAPPQGPKSSKAGRVLDGWSWGLPQRMVTSWPVACWMLRTLSGLVATAGCR